MTDLTGQVKFYYNSLTRGQGRQQPHYLSIVYVMSKKYVCARPKTLYNKEICVRRKRSSVSHYNLMMFFMFIHLRLFTGLKLLIHSLILLKPDKTKKKSGQTYALLQLYEERVLCTGLEAGRWFVQFQVH